MSGRANAVAPASISAVLSDVPVTTCDHVIFPIAEGGMFFNCAIILSIGPGAAGATDIGGPGAIQPTESETFIANEQKMPNVENEPKLQSISCC